VAEHAMPGIRVIPIKEKTTFQTFVAYRQDATLSSAAEFFVQALRRRMARADSPVVATAGA
jgi:DNA-binding transcriptional LysR family regulator